MRRGSGPRPAGPPIGAHLERARQGLRLTKLELATALGVLPRTLRRWESDEMAPTAKHLERYVAHIEGIDAEVGAALRAAVTGQRPPSPVVPSAAALNAALWRMAEEIEVPARKLRAAMVKWLAVAAAEGFTVEGAAAALGGEAAEGRR